MKKLNRYNSIFTESRTKLDDGIWYGGVWKDGNWDGDIWKDGTWINGIWEGGTWEKGTWKDGWWKGGLIYDPKKLGKFKLDWKWDGDYVYSYFDPKRYFNYDETGPY